MYEVTGKGECTVDGKQNGFGCLGVRAAAGMNLEWTQGNFGGRWKCSKLGGSEDCRGLDLPTPLVAGRQWGFRLGGFLDHLPPAAMS